LTWQGGIFPVLVALGTQFCAPSFGGNESMLILVGPWNFAVGVLKPAGLTGGGAGETELELSAGMERSGM